MIKMVSIATLLFTLSLSAHSAKMKNLAKEGDGFYGVFTTETMLKGCTVLDKAPLRAVQFYRINMGVDDVAAWIDDKTTYFTYMAMEKGMNAIVGFREKLSLSTGGGVMTLTGVGIKAECLSSKTK